MQVEQVSCDMSPAFIKGIGENFPQAAIVFDRFHVIKVINEAVDKVRKEEVKTNPILRKSKYLFLSNKNNLNEVQKERLDDIRFSKLNIKTVKAYHIKESFQQIYDTKTVDDFEKLLKKWYYWATHSKLGPIIQAAKTIKRHWHGIIN
jgi:transposase